MLIVKIHKVSNKITNVNTSTRQQFSISDLCKVTNKYKLAILNSCLF